VVLPTERLDEIARHAPYDLILLDVEIPTELRHPAGDQR
jgi:CheY-like chemotaxis protein